MATKSKTERWNFRVAESEDSIVRAAAELEDESFTNFVRCAALAEAERVLADRTSFAVDPPDWERFNDLLDRPATVPDGLRRLFSKQSVFDE